MKVIYLDRIEKFDDHDLLTYRLHDAESFFEVVPERGGIITRFSIAGKDVFYLNEETLYKKDANVRGGLPILFPISGQLVDGKYEWNGATYAMKNHGVARNRPWKVNGTNEQDGASLTLSLKSDESTKEEFPFDFELTFTYLLKNNVLTIKQEYRNISNEAMPIYAGFHPYFKTAEKRFSLDSDATMVLDYNNMEEQAFTGAIDLTNKKESLMLLDSKRKSVSFAFEDVKYKITLEYGPEFGYIVLWQEAGKEFICVEPWMAKTGELNRKEDLLYIEPNQSLKTMMSIKCETLS